MIVQNMSGWKVTLEMYIRGDLSLLMILDILQNCIIMGVGH